MTPKLTPEQRARLDMAAKGGGYYGPISSADLRQLIASYDARGERIGALEGEKAKQEQLAEAIRNKTIELNLPRHDADNGLLIVKNPRPCAVSDWYVSTEHGRHDLIINDADYRSAFPLAQSPSAPQSTRDTHETYIDGRDGYYCRHCGARWKKSEPEPPLPCVWPPSAPQGEGEEQSARRVGGPSVVLTPGKIAEVIDEHIGVTREDYTEADGRVIKVNVLHGSHEAADRLLALFNQHAGAPDGTAG